MAVLSGIANNSNVTIRSDIRISGYSPLRVHYFDTLITTTLTLRNLLPSGLE